MPLKTRVIPVLLWDNRGLCKPVQFVRPGRFIGSMMSAVKLYENRVCDELLLLDIDATPQGRRPRFKEIELFTSKIFCPLTVGGGIRTCDDIRDLLNAGADKVAIGAGAEVGFIEEASRKFGAQCITVALNVRPNERILSRIRAIRMEKAGAGEILLTSTFHDGVRGGYDLDLVRSVCEDVKIPVIANGGCREPEDMRQAILAGAHAVAASSMFLYEKITPARCKGYLHQYGIPVRLDS